MDLDKLLSKQENCINDNPPACITECPIHVDAKELIREVQKGDFEEAYRILKKRMPFTGVIAFACDHPCENACVTNADGKSISIHELEKAVVCYGRKAKIKTLPIPKNEKNIAVIGAGVSGLTCALDLNQKGYNVVLYEKRNEIGGSLFSRIGGTMDPEIIQEERNRLEDLEIEINFNQTITPEELNHILEEYDAVFLGTGEWGDQLNYNKTTLQTENEKLFVGGRIATNSESVIQSVSSGRIAAVSIDRYVHGKSLTALREKEGSYQSCLTVEFDPERILPRTLPEHNVYTQEEAILEAKRCVQCECHKCVKACIHLQKEKLDQKAYIRTINQNERIILGDHYANKTINSCLECGLCGAVCPSSIDMAEIIKETRGSMVSKEKMPLSAHDFALKDMEFSNSDYFELVKHQPGRDSSKYVFYPGCQLCASDPDYVVKAYQYLTETLTGGVGLYLGCCGAPADWSGRETLYQEIMDKTRANLETLGNPVIITACSTCFRNFTEMLEGREIVSLWEVFEEQGLPDGTLSGKGKTLAIHDACTTRQVSKIHESIRKIAERLDYNLIEPKFTKGTTKCCGYGGLAYYANRDLSREFTDDRIKDSDQDFLVYCANCKDLFLLRGKGTYHVLDLIFGNNMEEVVKRTVPTISERKANRFGLKKELLKNLWSEKMDLKDEYEDLKLKIDETVSEKMEEELILESDLKKVIGYAKETKNSFYNPENGHILAWRRLVNVTFWVEYIEEADAFRIINAYSHRMQVTGV